MLNETTEATSASIAGTRTIARNDSRRLWTLWTALKRPAILDGEIVALDDHGHSRFEWLVIRGPQRGTLVYYVFDLLMLDGKDLRRLPLLKRKQHLARLLTGHPRLPVVEYIPSAGLAMFAGALALGVEDIVAKDAESPYVEGPAPDLALQKIKNREYKRQGKAEFRQSGARK